MQDIFQKKNFKRIEIKRCCWKEAGKRANQDTVEPQVYFVVFAEPGSVVVETEAGEEYHDVVSQGDEDEESQRSRHQPLIGMKNIRMYILLQRSCLRQNCTRCRRPHSATVDSPTFVPFFHHTFIHSCLSDHINCSWWRIFWSPVINVGFFLFPPTFKGTYRSGWLETQNLSKNPSMCQCCFPAFNPMHAGIGIPEFDQEFIKSVLPIHLKPLTVNFRWFLNTVKWITGWFQLKMMLRMKKMSHLTFCPTGTTMQCWASDSSTKSQKIHMAKQQVCSRRNRRRS